MSMSTSDERKLVRLQKKVERLRDGASLQINRFYSQKADIGDSGQAFLEFDGMLAKYRLIIYNEVLALIQEQLKP